MSARQRLTDIFETHPDYMNMISPEDAVDEILAEHAHGLAEIIRIHKDEARGAVQATKVVDWCADLIDPEVP